jgi:hypothetical protein
MGGVVVILEKSFCKIAPGWQQKDVSNMTSLLAHW